MGNDMFRFNNHQSLVRFNLNQSSLHPRTMFVWCVVDINRSMRCHKDKFPQESMERYLQNGFDDSCHWGLIGIGLAKLDQAVGMV
jgi:hypothetical protein